jgi:ribosomal protein S18 acetylase RimI-like enzyme
MDDTILPFSRLTDDQVRDLARLHHRAMHSLLTDLGLPFLEHYYHLARADSSVVGVCAVGAGGSLSGWAVGSPQPSQLNGRLTEAKGWFVVQILRVLFTNPKAIWQASISSRSASVPMKEGALELTYIGVDKSARRRGLGRELLNAFIEVAREKKFTFIELSVEADNAAAIAMYTRAGFRIARSFKEGAFDRHRMELMVR